MTKEKHFEELGCNDDTKWTLGSGFQLKYEDAIIAIEHMKKGKISAHSIEFFSAL